MQLTDAQKELARQWIAEGMGLSDFQKRLETEFDIRLTYMEVRMLVGDLQVVPKDPEPPAAPTPEPEAAAPAPPTGPAPGGVSLTVDTVTQPGTVISGKVTFSDGQRASWYVDQYGRPGLAPETPGYRPQREDIQEFQVALDRELTRMGM